MYLLSVFHATIRFFMCGVPPPKCTSLYFVIKPFVHNYVLSSFVSIASRFCFPFKLVHLVVFVFQFTRIIDRWQETKSSLITSFHRLQVFVLLSLNIPDQPAKSQRHVLIRCFCPPCHGRTKTSKVWVQTNIFSLKEVNLISGDHLVIRNTFSLVNALIAISICEEENSFLKLLSVVGDYNSSFFIPRRNSSEYEIPPHRVNSWKLTS